MRREVILFFAAFAAGYSILLVNDLEKERGAVTAPGIQNMRANSARSEDVAAVFLDLILSDEEKFQIRLDEANTLSSLLALVEKTWSEGNRARQDVLSAKIAAKYPAEALRYYAAIPTNAAMNKCMFEGILDAWSDLDWRACISFVSQDTAVDPHSFFFWWGYLAEKRMKDHPQDCVEQFRLLSKEKQIVMSNSSFMTGRLGELLAPAINDDDIRNQMIKIKASLQTAELAPDLLPPIAVLEELPNVGPNDEQERDRCEALAKQWKETLPDDAELAAAMASIKSHSRRQDLLKQALEPCKDPPEDPQVWLKRISNSMTAVAEIMDSAPSVFTENTKAYREALREWLPAQSPRLQRAWAAELASREKPSQALQWIEGLDTEALRRDMRHDVLERWSQKEPDEAAAYIAENANDLERVIHLPEAVYGWALRDF